MNHDIILEEMALSYHSSIRCMSAIPTASKDLVSTTSLFWILGGGKSGEMLPEQMDWLKMDPGGHKDAGYTPAVFLLKDECRAGASHIG